MTTETPDLIVTSPTRSFGVRIVRKGDTFGREDVLTHKEDEPLVEFYDRTYCNKNGFGPRGQFVARYYLKTLLPTTSGLALDHSIREWDVPKSAMDEVRSFLRSI